jgi:hypothetical protein
VPLFNDWLNAFPVIKKEMVPINSPLGGDIKKSILIQSPETTRVISKEFIEDRATIFSYIDLSAFTKNSNILDNFWRFIIFGHQTGSWLLKKVIQSESNEFDKTITHELNIALGKDPDDQDALSNFVDWFEFMWAYEWMFAPKTKERLDPKAVAIKIAELKESKDFGINFGFEKSKIKRMQTITYAVPVVDPPKPEFISKPKSTLRFKRRRSGNGGRNIDDIRFD